MGGLRLEKRGVGNEDHPIMPDVFETVLGGYHDHVRHITGSRDPAAIEKVFAEMKASRHLEIVVIEGF